ncbi:MAG TPA: ABC transporter permease [Candidatus Limnocylindrales bacterium]|nr:ABC transporter permease [Candidatus Limnocylindrales bacterium]
MHPVAQDVRYGVRLLWKTPGYTAIALMALALGIGATTAIFSVVDAVLLKPLPFRDAGRLLIVLERNPTLHKNYMFLAPANLFDWREQSQSFTGIGAFRSGVRVNLTGGPNGRIQPEEIRAEYVTANLFSLLGAQTVVGRDFRADEDKPGHSNFALLSHRLWTSHFAADASISGKTIRVRNQSYTVAGVMPPNFAILDPAVDLWLPLAVNPADPRQANARSLSAVARLKPGVSLQQAQTEMDGIGAREEQANRTLNLGYRPALYPLRDQIAGKTKQALMVLSAAVGLLLLMACANVANLLLARGASRQKELAVRAALGAARSRIVVQLLSESVMLALTGGLIGIALAAGSVALLRRFGTDALPRLSEIALDGRVLLFALAVSVLTGIVFGIAPALRASGPSLNAALVETGRGGGVSRASRRLRSALACAEIALAVVVLIGAGLLIRSFVRMRAADAGFDPHNVLTFRLPLAGGRNATPDGAIAFFRQARAQLSGLPGVQSVGMIDTLPLTGLGTGYTFSVDGRAPSREEQRPIALARSIGPGYFRALRIPLVAGRDFTEADNKDAPPVIVVNQLLVRRFFPNQNPIGARLVLHDRGGRIAEIVGVVGDVKPERIDTADWPAMYLPFAQSTNPTMVMTLRTAQSPLAVATAAQRAIHQLDPDQPVADVRSMDSIVDEATGDARFNAMVLGLFAAIAFVLAAVGIYGVIAYDVSQRTNEIGLRMALGAESRDIARLVLMKGAELAATGIAVGLAAAVLLTRYMESMLYTVRATDFSTFAAMSVLLGVVALAASYLPSRRAMALDPVIALRHE